MMNGGGCLILACGNTLRSDDGVGPHLAHGVARHFAFDPRVRAIARQQWTPDLALEIAAADTAIFIDCAVDYGPGTVRLVAISDAGSTVDAGKHHLGAAELLHLARELYGAGPRPSLLLTVGAASLDLGEQFSAEVRAALPHARSLLQQTIRQLLDADLSAPRSPA